MRALYIRTLAALGAAVAAALIAGLVCVMALRDEAYADFERLLSGGGVRAVVARLEQDSQANWPTVIEAEQSHFDFPLRILPQSEAIAARGKAEPPRSTVVMSIGETGHTLVLGPVDHPSLGPVFWPVSVFITTLVLVASAIVALPLAQHLRRTQRAIDLLGQGQWDVRLDASGEGALQSLAARINRTAEQLAGLFREREDLLQAVCHELSTPVSRMRFQLELLKPSVPDQDHERITKLQRDLDELDDLSSELVGWVEAGAPNRALETFEVRPLLEQLLELACHDADHLVSRLDAHANATVHANLRQFHRAIENLLRNATRYAQGSLVVAVHEEHDAIRIDVRDDGPGIPEAHRQRLLEPFARLESSRSRAHGGLGLGLAIVQRILVAHQGAVSITDAPEGGACVQTRWPQAPCTGSANRVADVPGPTSPRPTAD